MTRIPIDPIGYKVNPETGVIHTRYADRHAAGYRTRTERGVLSLLDGKEGKACEVCYGKTPVHRPTTPRAPQVRRIPSTTEPTPDDAPSLP